MSESRRCPECGAGLPADAPGGLCARCLLGAAIERSGIGEASDTDFASEPPRPSADVDVDRFKREIVELGLIRAGDLERFSGDLRGVSALARALVLAGKLTQYQAGALSQGKARGLAVGNYFILEKLGAGGMGVVFKARHRRLGRVVALKILPPSLSRHPELLSRFRREVAVAAGVSHPNVVSVLDADEDRGVQFMTMEYIAGHDLDRLVRDGGVLPVDLALDCVIQAARGLEAVHARGIVHRDVKPGNLMLDSSGRVRVLDLGLARLVEAANPFGETTSGPLTRSGTFMGTVDFMAPEQGIDSRRVDHRADIYSLGCSLCYLLTGRAPFEGATLVAKLIAHQERTPATLAAARPEVSPAVETAYQKMMAKQPDGRPASMSEVIRRLDACRSSSGKVLDAQSGLQAFASTVVWKGGLAKGSEPGAPAVNVPVRVDSILTSEGVVLDLGPERRPDSIALPIVAQAARPDRPRRIEGPRKSVGPRAIAAAIGTIALLALGALGYSRIARGPGTASSGPSASAGSKADGLGSIPKSPAQPKPRSPGTFDVETLFSTHGEHDNNESSVQTIAVTADGRRALIGSWNEYCEIVDINSGSKVRPTLGPKGGVQGGYPSVAMSPDGLRGLIGTRETSEFSRKRFGVDGAGLLWFYDLTTGEERFPRRQPYHGGVAAVAVSPDGLRGLSASESGEVTLWDLATGDSTPLGSQRGEVSSHAAAFFPDGRRAATGGNDHLIHIWDLEAGRELTSWTGHTRTVSGLAISNDGSKLVSGGDDGKVILWETSGGTILHTFEMPPNDKGARVAFDSDGNIVAAGNGQGDLSDAPGNLIVWDVDTFAKLRAAERSFLPHMAVAALPGGRILTGDRFGLRLWTSRPPAAVADQPPPGTMASNDPVDLIERARLGLERPGTVEIGKWDFRGGGVLSPATVGARLEIPFTPPTEYRIDMEVEPEGKLGHYGFAMGVLVGGRRAEITIDKEIDQKGRCSGLAGLDGIPLSHASEFHQSQLLRPSDKSRLRLVVRRRSVEMICDGVVVADWSGDPKRFIPYTIWHVPNPQSPFLATGTSIRFHKMILTPLDADAP